MYVYYIMKTIKQKIDKKKSNYSKTKKQFLYNSKNPQKTLDLYTNDNPSDTIHIKYTTLEDVKNTIDKLEKLYKAKKYPHKRIWQVALIMKVRLEVLKEKKPDQYSLAKKYLDFLGKRTKLDDLGRYNITFQKITITKKLIFSFATAFS